MSSLRSRAQPLLDNLRRKPVGILAGGTVIAQASVLALLPVTTRIYTPEQVGLLVALTSVLGILIPFATLRFSTAILLPRGEVGSRLTTAVASFVLLTTASLLTVVLALSGAVKASIYTDHAVFLMTMFILSGINEIAHAINLRRQQYPRLAAAQIIKHGGGELAKIGLAVGLAPSSYTLLVGQVLGAASSVGVLLASVGKSLRFPRLKIRAIVLTMRKYRQFPAYHLPSELVRTFSFNAPLIFFSYHYGERWAGLLGIAFMMISGSSALVAQNVRQVFLSKIVRQVGGSKYILEQAHYYAWRLAFAGLAAMALVWALIDPFVSIALGDEWGGVSTLTKIMSLQLMPQMLGVALSGPLLTVLRLDSIIFKAEFRRLCLVILSLALGASLGLGPNETLLGYSVVISIHFGALFWVARKECIKRCAE